MTFWHEIPVKFAYTHAKHGDQFGKALLQSQHLQCMPSLAKTWEICKFCISFLIVQKFHDVWRSIIVQRYFFAKQANDFLRHIHHSLGVLRVRM